MSSINPFKKLNAKAAFKTKVSVALVSLCISASAFSAEVQLGVGNLNLKGGLLGLESDVNSSMSVVTLKENHANILKSDIFYNYSLSTYHSDRFKNEVEQLSTLDGGKLVVPETRYDWQGIDAQVTLGYDLIKKSPNDYFSVGLTVGMATPFIDNSGTAIGSLADSATLVPAGFTQSIDLFDSKTEFNGRKIGPKILFGKSLNRMASFYGQVSYARQNYQIKNDTLDFSTNVGGDYFSYELGMRYHPYSVKKEVGFMTLEPSLYFTVGVNYSQSSLDDLKVDLSGQSYKLDSEAFDMSATTLNFGVGYSF